MLRFSWQTLAFIVKITWPLPPPPAPGQIPGIAGSRLDDGAAGLEQAQSFPLLQTMDADPVLYCCRRG